MKALQHLKTILHHKNLVRKGCFRVGLYRQGIMHDWSKYTPTEFLVGCKYFQGTKSPNNAERIDKGYSSAWLHHKGRNKHHYEYWVDYGIDGRKCLIGMKMPVRYVVEMFLDRIAASKVYKGSAYQDSDPLDYFQKGGTADYVMHEDTKRLLTTLLVMLSQKGEEETFRYIREKVLRRKHRRTMRWLFRAGSVFRIHRRYIQV